MKLNKVFSIIKKDKQLLIQEGVNGAQWIGTKDAIYQISGLPNFTADNLFQLMGVAEDKKEKFELYENGFEASLDDMLTEDKDALTSRIYLRSGAEEYIPVSTSKGLVFIDGKYLEPVYDMPLLRLYERRDSNGGMYIVVKSGMLAFAIIVPRQVLSREAIEELEHIARCSRVKFNALEGGIKE